MYIDLELPLNGKEETFKLEFNRDAIKRMEAKGFSFENFTSKITTNTDLMLEGALYMHHNNLNATVRNKVIDAIYAAYDMTALNEMLVEMVVDAVPVLNDNKGQEKKMPILVR